MSKHNQPLAGIKVVEFSSIAPAPFCSMILADFGAEVILIERPGGLTAGVPLKGPPLLSRGKRSICLDLKDEVDRSLAHRIVRDADVLVEGFRPGVMERLGFGPEETSEHNPGLIYARVSGWGQDGPYAQRAGHDINYVGLAGPLAQVGTEGPVPPNTYVGDLAGGSLTAVIGVLMALHARTGSGLGQVVDVSIEEGAAQLMAPFFELEQNGYTASRKTNMTSGAAPFYSTYECRDGKWLTVGAIEPRFFRAFLDKIGLQDHTIDRQHDVSTWPELRGQVQEVLRARTRDDWIVHFAEDDVCVGPVLELNELIDDPHHVYRRTFRELGDGKVDANPAPRLSRTPGAAGEGLRSSGQHGDDIRREYAE